MHHDPPVARGTAGDIVSRLGRLLLPHLVAAVVTVTAVAGALLAGRASFASANALRAADASGLLAASAQYGIITVVAASASAILAALRHPRDGRRLCAVWGPALGLACLGSIALIVLWFFGLGEGLDHGTGEARQLAVIVAFALPSVTLVMIAAALAWGLLAPRAPMDLRRSARRCAGTVAAFATPGAAVAIWLACQADRLS